MKKIFTLLIVLTLSTYVAKAQVVVQDFSTVKNAIDEEIYGGFGGGNTAANAAVVDPVDATNTVRQYVTTADGDVWKGIFIRPQTHYIDLTTNQTVSLKIYSTTATYVKGIIQGGQSGQATIEAAGAEAHTGSGWETISFTFTGATGEWGEFAMRNSVDAAGDLNNTSSVTAYVDDLTAVQGTAFPVPAPPTTAAPTPPARNATDVISLYSDAYADVASNFDAEWCGAGSNEVVDIAGNATQKYLGNACQGIVLNDGVDASTFTNLHVDVYIEADTDLTSSVFNLKFVQQPGGGALEVNLNVASSPALVAGSWVSIDVAVDLSTFTGFKEFGITSNLNKKVWYDNLYVYKGTALSVGDVSNAGIVAYPNPVKNTLNINAATVVDQVQVFDLTGKQVHSSAPNAAKFSLDTSALKGGVYILSLRSENSETTMKLVK